MRLMALPCPREDLKRQIQGHSGFEALYLEKEPS